MSYRWREKGRNGPIRGLSTLGPGFGYGNLDDHDILNFIDNHDNQRDDHPYVVRFSSVNYRMCVCRGTQIPTSVAKFSQ